MICPNNVTSQVSQFKECSFFIGRKHLKLWVQTQFPEKGNETLHLGVHAVGCQCLKHMQTHASVHWLTECPWILKDAKAHGIHSFVWRRSAGVPWSMATRDSFSFPFSGNRVAFAKVSKWNSDFASWRWRFGECNTHYAMLEEILGLLGYMHAQTERA